MLAPVRTVAPADRLVSLELAREHLHFPPEEENASILAMIDAATDHLDGYTGILGRAMVEQTWRQDFPAFRDCLRLPLGPVLTKPAITYFDGNNAEQTLDLAVYRLGTDGGGAFIGRNPGQSWPSSYNRDDAVSVTFKAGMPVADVPAALTHAVLLLVAHWYLNREAVAASGMETLPLGVDRLIAPYRSRAL